MAQEKEKRRLEIGPFRVSYPHLKKPDDNGAYRVQALFLPDYDIKPLKKWCADAALKAFGVDRDKWHEFIKKNLESPFKLQDEKEENGEMPAGYTRGGVMVSLKSKGEPPTFINRRKELIDPGLFYAGCWAKAVVRPFGYGGPPGTEAYKKTRGNVGISIAMDGLMFWADDEPISGRTRPQDDFAQVEDELPEGASAEDLFD